MLFKTCRPLMDNLKQNFELNYFVAYLTIYNVRKCSFYCTKCVLPFGMKLVILPTNLIFFFKRPTALE